MYVALFQLKILEFSSHKSTHKFPAWFQIVGMRYFTDGQAQDLFLAIPKEFCKRLIDLEPVTSNIRQGHANTGVFNRFPKTHLAFVEGPLQANSSSRFQAGP